MSFCSVQSGGDVSNDPSKPLGSNEGFLHSQGFRDRPEQHVFEVPIPKLF